MKNKLNRLEYIQSEIAGLKMELSKHLLYTKLQSIGDIRVFMEHHVYAVWDFMSLLKALQNRLTCTQIPWIPVSNPSISRLINEIVCVEESDIDENGNIASHFEMYLNAMEEIGADSFKIREILASCASDITISSAFQITELTEAQRDFLAFTFNIIESNELHKIAAAFTFGREDLIPDMFIGILKEAKENNNQEYPKFRYYLNRHIEMDGDKHGPLSLEMINILCENDDKKWIDVLEVSFQALSHRINLWDAIVVEINNKDKVVPKIGG